VDTHQSGLLGRVFKGKNTRYFPPTSVCLLVFMKVERKMKVVEDKSRLFARKDTECHELRVSPDSDDILKVWIKEPTWLQVEQALGTMMKVDANQQLDINMDKMYRYMIDEFVEKTEPSLSSIEMLRLSPYVGAQLKVILPNPFGDSMEADTKKVS